MLGNFLILNPKVSFQRDCGLRLYCDRIKKLYVFVVYDCIVKFYKHTSPFSSLLSHETEACHIAVAAVQGSTNRRLVLAPVQYSSSVFTNTFISSPSRVFTQREYIRGVQIELTDLSFRVFFSSKKIKKKLRKKKK